MSTFVVHIEGYPLRVGRYIQKRGDGYRFRVRLPRKFVACFTRGEISASLATRSRRTAVRRARNPAGRAGAPSCPNLPLPSMTRTKAEALVRLWIDNARDACERDIAETGTAFFAGEDVARMGDENAQELDALNCGSPSSVTSRGTSRTTCVGASSEVCRRVLISPRSSPTSRLLWPRTSPPTASTDGSSPARSCAAWRR